MKQADPAVAAARPEDLGELVAAAVVPAPGDPADRGRPASALGDRLSGFKVPRRIVFITDDDVPQTPTGKVRLFDLAPMIEARLHATSTRRTDGHPDERPGVRRPGDAPGPPRRHPRRQADRRRQRAHRPPVAARSIDVGGMTVLPGLITCHLHPDFYKFDIGAGEQPGKELPPGVMMAIGVRTCRVLLESGFTGYAGAPARTTSTRSSRWPSPRTSSPARASAPAATTSAPPAT